MARILTGVQSSGIPHLGNILGAIVPAISLSKEDNNDSLFFIADFHSLTSVRDANLMRENTYATAAAWLAFGLDTNKTIFYKQSDVPEVCELNWFLSCFTPMPMLENAHSFKDKSDKFSKDKISAGLFTYPVLMAADILLYNAEVVPVGKDQKQHLEITRDIAKSFNHQYGDTFVIPESKIANDVMTIPGTDGNKMSKSYGNFINIFLPDKKLRKVIMSIQTDSLSVEEPKIAENCNVFNLYKLLATASQTIKMKENYEAGNYGYGQAKQALFEVIIEKFSKEREAFNTFMEDTTLIDLQLSKGASKARVIATEVLDSVKIKLGFK